MDILKKPNRDSNIVWRNFKGKIILDTGHILNPVGGSIWELSDGDHTIEQIIEEILLEYQSDKEKVRNDVISFLNMLLENKLISFK